MDTPDWRPAIAGDRCFCGICRKSRWALSELQDLEFLAPRTATHKRTVDQRTAGADRFRDAARYQRRFRHRLSRYPLRAAAGRRVALAAARTTATLARRARGAAARNGLLAANLGADSFFRPDGGSVRIKF